MTTLVMTQERQYVRFDQARSIRQVYQTGLLPLLLLVQIVCAQQTRGNSPVSTDLRLKQNGVTTATVSNLAQVPITALLVLGTRTLKPADQKTKIVESVRFYDSVLGLSSSNPLPAGAKHAFSFLARTLLQR